MAKRELYNIKVAAQKIQKWQKESGFLGKEIAEMIGVSPPYYSDIRKGKQRGSLPVLAKIADVLGRSVEELLTDEKIDPNPIRVTELRKVLRPILKGDTDDIIEGIQLWRMAPRNYRAAFRAMLDV